MSKSKSETAKLKEAALRQLTPEQRKKFVPVVSAGKVYFYDRDEYLARQRTSQRKNAAIYAQRRKEKRARKLLEDPAEREKLLNAIKQEAKAKA